MSQTIIHKKNVMKHLLLFNTRDQLLRLDISRLVYFEADGNYTHVVAMNKLKSTIGTTLARTEAALEQQLGEQARRFMRVGKRFIVNLDFVYSIDMAHQRLVMSDMATFAFQLPISKDALRRMRELIVEARV